MIKNDEDEVVEPERGVQMVEIEGWRKIEGVDVLPLISRSRALKIEDPWSNISQNRP